MIINSIVNCYTLFVIYLFIFYKNVTTEPLQSSIQDYLMPLNESEMSIKLLDFNIAIEKNLIWIEKIKSKDKDRMSLIDQITQKFEIQDIIHFLRDIRTQIRLSQYNNYKDEKLKRQLDILTKTEFDILPLNDLILLNDLLSKWNKHFIDTKYCSFEVNTKCDYDESFIETEILNTNDINKIKWYWENWLETDKMNQTKLYFDLIKLFIMTAKLHGFTDPNEMFTYKYEMKNINEKLKNEMKLIFPLYQNLHGYIRNNLQLNLTKPNSPIPDYILNKVISTSYHHNNYSKLAYPFPNINLQTIDFDNNIKMLEKVEEFYKSIGIDIKSIKYSTEFTNDTTVPQFIDKFGRREQILKIGNEVTELNFLRTVVQILNLLEYNFGLVQPLAFRKITPKAFRMAISNAIALSVTSPSYILKNNQLDKEKLTDNKNFIIINKLYKMALQILLPMQKSLVVSETMKCMVTGKYINDCLYWKRKLDLQGVFGEGRIDDFDVLSEKNNNINEDDLGDLFSLIVGFQIYEGLCKRTDQYSDENPDNFLINCDFSENLLIGEILKKVLSDGGSKNWQEHFKYIIQTNDTEISVNSLLKYFKPLNDWLMKHNKENDIPIGWTLEE